MQKNITYLFGAISIFFYLSLLFVLVLYFNDSKKEKSLHFVKKNETKIQVQISTPTKAVKSKSKPTVTKEKKKKAKPTVKKSIKNQTKPLIKKRKPKPTIKKVSKKPKIKKKVKKQSINELFSNAPKSKKPSSHKKVSKKVDTSHTKVKKQSASALFSKSKSTRKKQDKGTKNAYWALVSDKLMGWPAQSEYAGEKAKVWMKINPDGHFIFKIVTFSKNSDFNEGLRSYLKQLNRFGLGKHKAKRAYEINVDFIATD
jgi:protein TonB